MAASRATRSVPVPLTVALRREMANMCASKRTRSEAFSTAQPTEWRPTDAIDPTTKAPCTSSAAWSLVEQYVRGNGPIIPVLLKKPPGRTGYTFHLRDGDGNRIYVKLQIGSGKVFGRSFHLG